MKRIVCILLLALLLTACGKEKIQEPTVTTDPTTATTSMTEAEELEKLIRDNYWYKRALGCIFEKPEDIPAWFYFYLGIDEFGHNDYKYFTSEEQDFLAKTYKEKYGIEEYTMATRMPVDKINEGLSILGVTLEDIEIPEDWVYYDKTDAYYFWVSDAYIVHGKVTEVEKGLNGIVKIYWESTDTIWDTTNKAPYPAGTKMAMTMQQKADGTYMVWSNVPQE